MRKVPEWFVIAGAPCSGKTTVVNRLAELGFKTVPEIARILIDKGLSEGKSLEQIRRNDAAFQRQIFLLHLEKERELPKNTVTFFDTATPCSLAYFRNCGLDTKEVLEACKKKMYKKVFFLERLPYKKDYARLEDDEAAARLAKLLKEGYESLGYDVVSIPPMPVEERVRMILKECGLTIKNLQTSNHDGKRNIFK